MRIAYFDCPSGASGDMVLGALVDAGWEIGALEDALASLGVD
ncbi:MAG TPA: nickel insertion protein, partial [Methylomirabilota bacterium]